MNDMNESIIKSDRRGRIRYTTEHKQALIEAYEASGLSGLRLAELHFVHYQTLAYWLKNAAGSERRGEHAARKQAGFERRGDWSRADLVFVE